MIVVDTSILIDVLRGDLRALELLRPRISDGPIHASEITRLEILSGMRESEKEPTWALLDILTWHEVDQGIAEIAGELGRQWIPPHRGVDSADLCIAATAICLDVPLITRNTKHFPMFPDLQAPY